MFYLKKLLFLGVSLISFSALAVPFWKAEKEGKHLYMLGIIHQGVSLSELSCAEKIEDKLKQSESVFTEMYTTNLDLDIGEGKKLHLGSQKEREEIMNKLTEDAKKAVQSRHNRSRLFIIKQMLSLYQNFGIAIKKDQGKFEDLNLKSQEFIKYYGLYAKDKSYYDYFFDMILREDYEQSYFFEKDLDFEIIELARENDIPIKQLDNDDNTISDLKEEVKKMEKAKFKRNYEITDGEIYNIIEDYVTNYVENYETTREAFIKEYELKRVSKYKTEDWSSLLGKVESDALLKNRNELWVEKILSTSENADKALFIAGGAAHFIFSDNVLDMLEDEGFTIKKINEENCQF